MQTNFIVYYLCIFNFSQEAHDILSITRTHNKNMIIDILSITRTHKKNIIDDIISITRTHKKNMIIDILSITRTHCLLNNLNYFFCFTITLKNDIHDDSQCHCDSQNFTKFKNFALFQILLQNITIDMFCDAKLWILLS